MRKDWEIRILGDVCQIINGKNQKKVANPDGQYPIYGSGGIMGYADQYLCDEGCTVIGRKGSINSPIFVETKFWNVDTAFGLSPNINLKDRFLYYFCLSFNFLRLNKSTTLPSLTKSDLLKINIRIPSKEKQELVVHELDTLNDIITKKKQQLEELNKLAQATFYEMFGDPMLNEKKWNYNTLKVVCTKITDGTHNSPVNEPEGKYAYITAKNIKKYGIDISNISYVSEAVHKEIYSRCNPEKGDILYIKDGATTGVAQVNDFDFEFSMLSSVALLKLKKEMVDPLYIKSVLNSPSVYQSNRSNMGGAAITRLTLDKIKRIKIPVPPFLHQQDFGIKIFAIESQKTNIQQSLTDTQQLFDYTMNKYFGS